ncbi:MAG: hypothetical protein ABSC19_17470 [Syntrophorhabdales bacterium]|jgi:hypothetical protein
MGNEKSLPDLIAKGKAEEAPDESAEGKACIALPRIDLLRAGPKEGCSQIVVNSPGTEDR